MEEWNYIKFLAIQLYKYNKMIQIKALKLDEKGMMLMINFCMYADIRHRILNG